LYTTQNFDDQFMSIESKIMRDTSIMPVQIYEASNKYADIRFKLGELRKHRYLLTSLVQRDLKSRYKNSLLGILWSLLNPLALMLVFTLVFTVLSNGGTQRQHPVFLLTGLLPWNFFSGTMMGVTFNPAQFMRWINPMASLIDEYRTVLWGTTSSTGPVGMDPAYFLRTFITAVTIFLIGYIIFARTEHVFGEKL